MRRGSNGESRTSMLKTTPREEKKSRVLTNQTELELKIALAATRVNKPIIERHSTKKKDGVRDEVELL